MKDLIIFGAGTIGRLAAWYFGKSSRYRLIGFCAEDAFCPPSTIDGLPVLPLSLFEKQYPPGACHLFVALGYQKQNKIRQQKLAYFLDKGYSMASCIAESAIINNDGQYGHNCFIMENAVLQPFSRIGNNCIIWSGSIVAHEALLEDNCFLSANSVVGGMSKIGSNTFIGINATVRDSVEIGSSCILGAGSVVLSSLPPDSFVSPRATPAAPWPASKAMRFIEI